MLRRTCRFLQDATTDPGDTAVLSRALQAGRDAVVVLKNYRSDGSPFRNEVAISPSYGVSTTLMQPSAFC